MIYYINNTSNQNPENPTTKIFYDFSVINPGDNTVTLSPFGRDKNIPYIVRDISGQKTVYKNKKISLYIVIDNSSKHNNKIDYINNTLKNIWSCIYENKDITKNIMISVICIGSNGVNYLYKNQTALSTYKEPTITYVNKTIDIIDFLNDYSLLYHKTEKSKTKKIINDSLEPLILIFTSTDKTPTSIETWYNNMYKGLQQRANIIVYDLKDTNNIFLKNQISSIPNYYVPYNGTIPVSGNSTTENNIKVDSYLKNNMTYIEYTYNIDIDFENITTNRVIQYFTYLKKLDAWMCYWTFDYNSPTTIYIPEEPPDIYIPEEQT